MISPPLPVIIFAFVAGVYAFGFLFMLPQLYINYMVIYSLFLFFIFFLFFRIVFLFVSVHGLRACQ